MNYEIGDEVKDIQERIENDAAKLDEVVKSIIYPYCKDLDKCVESIKTIMQDTKNPPTAQELDDMCIKLPIYIYYASAMQEQLGIKSDISKALYKEMYHSSRDKLDKGTVADKDSLAELASQQEALVSMLYSRAYSTVKAKVSAAQELLSSTKKVVTRRITEMELTRISGGN